ncbi:hypothetical protein G039_0327200 [Pseudomonas aeruginosa VRFPA01]|nr:hypothetical protein G039_0327200 [Pseudomonas aeruginosa VRFPA01]
MLWRGLRQTGLDYALILLPGGGRCDGKTIGPFAPGRTRSPSGRRGFVIVLLVGLGSEQIWGQAADLLEQFRWHERKGLGIVPGSSQYMVGDTLNHAISGSESTLDQCHIAGVQGAGLPEPDRGVVDLEQLAEDIPGQRVTPLANETYPPGQPQHHQGAGSGFKARTLSQGNGGQVPAQLVVAGERAQAIRPLKHVQYLPAVAFQGRQAGVQHQGGGGSEFLGQGMTRGEVHGMCS